MIKRTLSASAFIVNESRARAEDLSLDVYAKLWVDDDVRALWRLFENEVYQDDPRALAVRNRFFMEAVNTFFRDNPNGIFVNVAAGFTAYPFLMDTPVQTIEIDLPAVVEYKRAKVLEWMEQERLPRRDVIYMAGDLGTGKGRKAIETALSRAIGDRPSFMLLEGISYYLKRDVFFSFMETACRIQTPGSRLSMDYWEPGNTNNTIFLKFSDFLERRCNHPNRDYNLMTPGDIQSIAGYRAAVETDVSAVERQISDRPVLQDWATRLPENFVTLVKL